MEQLEIRFQGGTLAGTGSDIVGPFRLDGVCTPDRVAIVKQYLGQHHVEYYGTFDGEGTLYGEWGWDGLRGGTWTIRVSRAPASERREVIDITESLIPPSE